MNRKMMKKALTLSVIASMSLVTAQASFNGLGGGYSGGKKSQTTVTNHSKSTTTWSWQTANWQTVAHYKKMGYQSKPATGSGYGYGFGWGTNYQSFYVPNTTTQRWQTSKTTYNPYLFSLGSATSMNKSSQFKFTPNANGRYTNKVFFQGGMRNIAWLKSYKQDHRWWKREGRPYANHAIWNLPDATAKRKGDTWGLDAWEGDENLNIDAHKGKYANDYASHQGEKYATWDSNYVVTTDRKNHQIGMTGSGGSGYGKGKRYSYSGSAIAVQESMMGLSGVTEDVVGGEYFNGSTKKQSDGGLHHPPKVTDEVINVRWDMSKLANETYEIYEDRFIDKNGNEYDYKRREVRTQ